MAARWSSFHFAIRTSAPFSGRAGLLQATGRVTSTAPPRTNITAPRPKRLRTRWAEGEHGCSDTGALLCPGVEYAILRRIAKPRWTSVRPGRIIHARPAAVPGTSPAVEGA